MAYKISKRSSYAIGKMIEHYKDGYFEHGLFGSIGHRDNVWGTKYQNRAKRKLHIYNDSDIYIQAGNLAYVHGCNMPAYLYEEALFYVMNNQACVSVRALQAGDNPDDQTQINSDIEPWCTVLQESEGNDTSLFFASVLLSDDFDGSNDFYYAKPWGDALESYTEYGYIYYPTFITAKKDDMATYRIFDGSDLPAQLVYPDYYNSRKARYSNPPPKVVLALMKKLDASPDSPHIGRYLATVVNDTTITESSKSVLVEVSTGSETFQESASSPLSAKGDKFKKGQKVLIAPFENGGADYVIINAEC